MSTTYEATINKKQVRWLTPLYSDPAVATALQSRLAGVRQSVLEMVAEGAPHAVVVDLDAATLMDMDGTEMLTKLHEELERKNVRLVLARVADEELDLLQKTGTLGAIARGNCYPTVREAVAAAQELAMPSSGAQAAADAA